MEKAEEEEAARPGPQPCIPPSPKKKVQKIVGLVRETTLFLILSLSLYFLAGSAQTESMATFSFFFYCLATRPRVRSRPLAKATGQGQVN